MKAPTIPLQVGDTYLDKESFKDPYHLWVVLLVLEDGSALVVNVTEYEDGCDPTCILGAGEHPFLYKDKSIVLYSHHDVVSAKDAAYNVSKNLWLARERATDALVQKVREGALRSPYIAPEHKKALLSEMGPQPGVVVEKRRLTRRRS